MAAPWDLDWTDSPASAPTSAPPDASATPDATPNGMESGFLPWTHDWDMGQSPTNDTSAPDMFLRGMTGGGSDYVGAAGRYLGDHLASLLGANIPQLPSFGDDLKAERTSVDNYTAHNPVSAYGMEGLGGITSPALGAVAKGIGALTATLPRFAGYALQGGSLGGLLGLTGARSQDDGLPTIPDLNQAASRGVDLGLAFGAGLPALFEGGAAVANKIAPGFISKLATNGDDFFTRAQAVAKAMQRDRITPDQASDVLSTLGPKATLADIGPNMTGLGEAVVSQPGEALTDGTQTLGERTQGMGSRLLETIRNNLAGGDYYGAMDALSEKQAQEASPLFKEAFAANKSVSSPVIDRILQTPSGQAALDYARTRMQNKMALLATPDPDLTEQYNDLVAAGKMEPGQSPGGVGSGLKMQTLDLIRQGFGDQERALVKQVASGNAKPGELADVGNLRRGLTSEMNRLDVTAQAGPNSLKTEGGAYARALRAYADPAQLKEAMETGADMVGNEAALNARTVADMTPAERQAAQVGLVKGLRDQISNARDGTNVAARVFGSPEQRAAIRPLFDSDDQFNAVINAAKAESNMAANSNRILQNSRTQPRQAAVRDLAGGSNPLVGPLRSALISLFHGNVREAGTQALAGLAGKQESNIPEDLANGIGRMIFSQDPVQNQQTLDAIRNLPDLRAAAVRSYILSRGGRLPMQFGGALSPFMTGPSNQTP